MADTATEPDTRRYRTGEVATLDISELLPSGEGGSGRIRVAGAFPGERVAARVDHVGKHASFATATEIEVGREARRKPVCDRHTSVAGKCTGCPLMALEETDQRLVLQEMLKKQYGLVVDKVEASPEELGYRWSAKRIAFGAPGNLCLGSFVRGTHRPADMERCRVDHPLISAAADEIGSVARDLRLPSHDERTETPGLRAVWLKTNGEKVLVTLVSSDENQGLTLELARALKQCDGVSVCMHTEAGNSLRGLTARHVCGVESLNVFDVRVGPLGFLQPNPLMAERMYDWLVSGIDEGPVLDLYAGAGATTRRLRASGLEVTPSELQPEAAESLEITPQSAEVFLQAQQGSVGAIVANPPRKGLGAAVTTEILRLSPPKVHLMQCGPAGLAADLKALDANYVVESLRAFDTLPQTTHLELVAKLRRK